MNVEPLAKNDFTDLMEMLLESYRFDWPAIPDFDQRYPDVYRPDDESMAWNYVIRRQGTIAACVGLFPIPWWIEGQATRVAGIGGVSTRPAFRNQGLMQRLLDHVRERMIEQGYALSILGGDRRRYRPWGYEMVVNQFGRALSGRAPGFSTFHGKLPGNIHEGTVEQVPWSTIWAQCQTHPSLAVCGSQTLRLKYRRLHHRIYYVDAEPGAHILVQEEGKDRQLVAWAGDPTLVGALLVDRLTAGWDAIQVYTPWFEDRYTRVFDDLTADGYMARASSIAILNLKKMLDLFHPHLKRRVEQFQLKGRTQLVMAPLNKVPAQIVRIEADGRDLSIMESGHTSPDALELSCWQLVEMMFTPAIVNWSARLAPEQRWLTALFPLPFYRFPIYGA